MANYKYLCEFGHSQPENHAMTADPEIFCKVCGTEMHRAPSVVIGINWNGNPPSKGSPAPAVQTLIDTAEARRDNYYVQKAKRDGN